MLWLLYNLVMDIYRLGMQSGNIILESYILNIQVNRYYRLSHNASVMSSVIYEHLLHRWGDGEGGGGRREEEEGGGGGGRGVSTSAHLCRLLHQICKCKVFYLIVHRQQLWYWIAENVPNVNITVQQCTLTLVLTIDYTVGKVMFLSLQHMLSIEKSFDLILRLKVHNSLTFM